MLKLPLVTIILFVTLGNSYDYKSYSYGYKKYFEVIVDRVEIVEETPSLLEWHVQVRKVNKTRALVGVIISHVAFGNEFKIEGKGLKKQGGEYRYMSYNVPVGSFCDTLSKDEYVYPDFAKNSDLPQDIANNCPLPPGNYSLKGVTLSMENIPQTVVQSGEYGIELIFSRNDKHFATYRIYTFVNNI